MAGKPKSANPRYEYISIAEVREVMGKIRETIQIAKEREAELDKQYRTLLRENKGTSRVEEEIKKMKAARGGTEALARKTVSFIGSSIKEERKELSPGVLGSFKNSMVETFSDHLLVAVMLAPLIVAVPDAIVGLMHGGSVLGAAEIVATGALIVPTLATLLKFGSSIRDGVVQFFKDHEKVKAFTGSKGAR